MKTEIGAERPRRRLPTLARHRRVRQAAAVSEKPRIVYLSTTHRAEYQGVGTGHLPRRGLKEPAVFPGARPIRYVLGSRRTSDPS
jgi:hypothetical protein